MNRLFNKFLKNTLCPCGSGMRVARCHCTKKENSVKSPLSVSVNGKSDEPLPERCCGKCEHWHELPPDPTNLGAHRGECREGPPTMTMIPNGQGGIMTVVGYAQPPQHLAPCSRYKPVLTVEEITAD